MEKMILNGINKPKSAKVSDDDSHIVELQFNSAEDAYYYAKEFDGILNSESKLLYDAKDPDWNKFKKERGL